MFIADISQGSLMHQEIIIHSIEDVGSIERDPSDILIEQSFIKTFSYMWFLRFRCGIPDHHINHVVPVTDTLYILRGLKQLLLLDFREGCYNATVNQESLSYVF